MPKKSVLLTSFMFLTSAAGVSGQVADAPAHEKSPGEMAIRDRRLENAVAEIAALKRLLAEQGQRITVLERLVRASQSPALSAAGSATAVSVAKPKRRNAVRRTALRLARSRHLFSAIRRSQACIGRAVSNRDSADHAETKLSCSTS